MRVGSLFSGVGGFDLGFERAGMKCAWTVEYDKQARSVLRKHWPEVSHYEDVHDVKGECNTVGGRGRGKPVHGEPNKAVHASGADTIHRPVDLICGGFPCQDYSVAGKRGGLAGDRGALWWQMHRIIAECRPEWVVGENVPGLLSSNGGRDFLTIIASLVELGYGVTWATLDSQYFGVAQRRRRLFIVGHSGGIARPEILALGEGLRGHPAPSREAREEVAGSLGGGAAGERGWRNDLDTSGAFPLQPVAFTSESVHQDGTHQDGTHHPLRVEGRAAIAFNGNNTTKTGFELTPTMGTHGTAYVGVSGPTPRRLTPVECERLQGFPDGWTAKGITNEDNHKALADGPRYRMMGNAVTVNVAEWIGRRLMETCFIPSEGETP